MADTGEEITKADGGDTSENVEPEQPTEAEEPGAVEPDAAPADKPEPAARGATETSLDLSLLRPKYNTRSKSNLKHVLTEYGMPEEVPAAVKTTKKKEKEKKVEKKEILQPKPPKRERDRTSKTTDSNNSEADAEKLRQKQEHYMQVYVDIHRLRDLFYEEYTYQLRSKIDKQKEQIRRRDLKSQNMARQREEKEREEANRMKKRMGRHDFVHDDSFLKGIPKTQYYKIIGLADQMKTEGKLRTQTQIDEFWRNIRRPDIYYQHFPPSVSESQTLSTNDASSMVQTQFSKSRASSTEPQPVPSPHTMAGSIVDGPRALTQIREDGESRPVSRTPGRQQEWAITQQAQHVHKSSTASSKKKSDPYSIARQAAAELDRTFPPMELPKLHCFTDLDLGEKPPDPIEIMKQIEMKRREKDRHHYVKKLRQMYQLALSNTASAQRIISNKTDNELENLRPSVRELTAACLHMNVEPEREEDQEYPWTKYLTRPHILPIMEVSEENSMEESVASKDAAEASEHGTRNASPVPVPPSAPRRLPPPMHLTLDSLKGTTRTVEAKGPSTLWTNYMGCGRPVAAES